MGRLRIEQAIEKPKNFYVQPMDMNCGVGECWRVSGAVHGRGEGDKGEAKT